MKKSFCFYGLAALLLATPANADEGYPHDGIHYLSAEECAKDNPSDDVYCIYDKGIGWGGSWTVVAEFPTGTKTPYRYTGDPNEPIDCISEVWAYFGTTSDVIRDNLGNYYPYSDELIGQLESPVICHFDWGVNEDNYTCEEYIQNKTYSTSPIMLEQYNCAKNEVYDRTTGFCVSVTPCSAAAAPGYNGTTQHCNYKFSELRLDSPELARQMIRFYLQEQHKSVCQIVETGSEQGKGLVNELGCLLSNGHYQSFQFAEIHNDVSTRKTNDSLTLGLCQTLGLVSVDSNGYHHCNVTPSECSDLCREANYSYQFDGSFDCLYSGITSKCEAEFKKRK